MRADHSMNASSVSKTSEELNCLRCFRSFPRTVDIYGETEMLCNTCRNTANSEFIDFSGAERLKPIQARDSRDAAPQESRDRQVQWRLVEQRRNQRKKHLIPAQIEFVRLSARREQMDGHLKDISASGAAVTFPAEFPGKVAHRSKVRLTLTRADAVVRWSGYLARLSRGENNSSVIGIAFYKPQPEVMATLESHISITIEVSESDKKPRSFPRVLSPADAKREKIKRAPGPGSSHPGSGGQGA